MNFHPIGQPKKYLSLWLGEIEVAPRQANKREIAEYVAEKYGLSLGELRGQERRRYVSHPRQEAMWEMRQIRTLDGRHKYSLPQIGEFFGNRDHTTVLHAIRAHERRLRSQEGA